MVNTCLTFIKQYGRRKESGLSKMGEVVSFREAVLGDKEAVVALSTGKLQGINYTESCFPEWLSDNRWHPFVAETSSHKVIGFTVLNITNGEESVVVRHSRLDEEHQGKGIYKRLLNFAIISTKKLFPSLKNVIKGTISERDLSVGFVLLKAVARLVICCKETAIKSLKISSQSQSMISDFKEEVLTAKSFKRFYTEDEMFKGLFVGEVLSFEGEVLDLNYDENWGYLSQRPELLFLCTRTPEKIAFSVINRNPIATNDGGFLIDIAHYGDDVDILKFHLLRCMQIGFQKINGDFKVSFILTSAKNENLLIQAIKEEFENFKIIFETRYKFSQGTIHDLLQE